MKKKICATGIIFVIFIIIIYCAGVIFFQNHFLFHVSVNGVNVACMTYEKALDELNKKVNDYEIKVLGRENLEFVITGEEIGLQADWGKSIEDLINHANEYAWFVSLIHHKEIERSYELSIEDELLKKILDEQEALKKEEMRSPQNAEIGDYVQDEFRYEMISADRGTYVLKKKLFPYVKEAILMMKDEIDISELDCYVKPTIDEEDDRLNDTFDKLNRMVSTKIMYQFGEICEQLDGNTINMWIKRDGYAVSLDESQVAEYVKYISKNYDTAYRKHRFTTVDGLDITISQGHYGWWMNRKEEAKELAELIDQGANTDRKAIYYQEAASFEYPDYGSTYLEIDLTNQHLYFWIDGEIYLETDFVSGNVSQGAATPEGIYPITYKERNTTLRGADYASDVSYWMPFNGGIGLHDASWRKSFGGTIYLTNGSHGCINLPVDMAEKIYEQVYTEMPVICYYRTGW